MTKGSVSHAKSKRKSKGYKASRRVARLDRKAQRLLDKALKEKELGA